MLENRFDPERTVHLYPHPIGENVFDALLRMRRGLSLVMGHVDFGIHEQFAIERPRYFTFVRNPVERVISEFHYFKKRNAELPREKWRKKNEIVDACSTVEEFVLSPARIRNPIASRVCGKMFGKSVAFENARSNVENWFSFIGVTERMSDSLRAMSGALGVEFKDAPHVNRTSRSDCSELDRERIEESMRESDKIDFEFYQWCVAALG